MWVFLVESGGRHPPVPGTFLSFTAVQVANVCIFQHYNRANGDKLSWFFFFKSTITSFLSHRLELG